MAGAERSPAPGSSSSCSLTLFWNLTESLTFNATEVGGLLKERRQILRSSKPKGEAAFLSSLLYS